MLIKGAILVVLIIAAFFFLGIKMSESITNPGIRGFFFALYFITIFTVFNIILSFYFIIKLQGKRGPQGKKGLQGSNGDRGEPGTCDNTTCERKSLELLIRNKVEQDLTEHGGLTEQENKIMCAFFKKLNQDSFDYKSKINYINDTNDIKYVINNDNREKRNSDVISENPILKYLKDNIDNSIQVTADDLKNC